MNTISLRSVVGSSIPSSAGNGEQRRAPGNLDLMPRRIVHVIIATAVTVVAVAAMRRRARVGPASKGTWDPV